MLHAVGGPGSSVSQQDLWNLKVMFGLPQNFSSIKEVSVAGKARVFVKDSIRPEGPLLPEMRWALFRARQDTPYPQREHDYRHWLQQAHAEMIYRAVTKLKENNLHPIKIYKEVRDGYAKGTPQEKAAKAAGAIQGEIRRRWHQRCHPTCHFRIRQRIERWKFSGRPRNVAEELQKNATEVAKAVPPRVSAALFQTAWNRWTTARRFQKRNHSDNMLSPRSPLLVFATSLSQWLERTMIRRHFGSSIDPLHACGRKGIYMVAELSATVQLSSRGSRAPWRLKQNR